MTTAVVRVATMISTIMPTFSMLMVVVVALDVRVIAEIVRKIRLDRCIARTADTAVELDARTRKCHLCAAADTAADQGIYVLLREKSRKRAVTAAVRIHDLRRNDLTILYCVDLKLLGMSEVLKDLSVFISYCNFHKFISISLFIVIYTSCSSTSN